MHSSAYDGAVHALNLIPVDIDELVMRLIVTGLIVGSSSYSGRLMDKMIRAEEDNSLKARLLDSAADAIFVHDLEGRFVYLNEAAWKGRGYTKEEMLGMNLCELDAPECAELIPGRIGELLEKGSTVFECTQRRKDGSVINLEVHGSIFDSGNGKLVLSATRDITGRKEAEKALKRELDINNAMAGLSEALITARPIKEISALVLHEARKLTGSRFGYVGYIDRKTGYLVSPTLTDDVWKECNIKNKEIVFREFNGLWGWVLKNRSSLLTNSPESDPRSTGVPAGHVPIERFLSVPALMEERLVGQISLANPERDYTEDDLAVLKKLAALYAVAVDRAMVDMDLRERMDELERYSRATVDRELRMKELRERIKRLEKAMPDN